MHPAHLTIRGAWVGFAAAALCLLTLGTGPLVAGAPGVAASPGRPLLVLSADAEPYRRAEAAFRRSWDGGADTAMLSELRGRGAAAIASSGHAIFVAVGTEAAAWLRAALPEGASMVYCMVADPDGAGLTGPPRIHGVSTAVSLDAQLSLLSETLPRARTIGALYRSDRDHSRRQIEALSDALPPGWRVEAVAIDAHASVSAAIDEMLSRGVDVVWTAPDSAVYDVNTIRGLLLASLRRNVPVFGFSAAFVRAGALVGIGVDSATQGKQAAEIAGRLRGSPAHRQQTPASESPIYLEPEFEVAVNLVVAERLSVSIPRRVVDRATHVFDGR